MAARWAVTAPRGHQLATGYGSGQGRRAARISTSAARAPASATQWWHVMALQVRRPACRNIQRAILQTASWAVAVRVRSTPATARAALALQLAAGRAALVLGVKPRRGLLAQRDHQLLRAHAQRLGAL